ncbi:3-oxoacyl-ACP reductase [Streptomyces lasiicapitis]|uniref:3-oxoacyl-ACP reductase n=1 Tax=Streptomyces lasiicapitis TaxID=1923961 RepID=A0ABQ2MJD0_9ACTN|nr:3-oxoacyl-ACP reductase [Streptomyces lasiicapitis]GGO52846.1 3-oxoacyl-ACP reductase [Streptomyces lasiicapitis]
MADRYVTFTRTAPGRFLTRRLGLPQPVPLHRWSPRRPRLGGPLLLLTAGDIPLAGLHEALTRTGLPPHAGPLGSRRPAAVVLDATGVSTVAALADVHTTLHPVVRSIAPSGRVVVLGAPLSPDDHHQAAAQQALEGFVRSLGKEIGRGRTVQLVRTPSAPAAEATLRFLLSPKSAYVSGQVIEAADEVAAEAEAWADADFEAAVVADAGAGPGSEPVIELPHPARLLAGRTALVTGAARGIGAAVAEVLARDGARVVVLDVPSAEEELVRVAERVGGTALPLDITANDAGERIAAALPGDLGILVHNAGITRDRRLANMAADRWSSVVDVNLASVLRTTDFLLKSGTVRRGGRIVATASISGLAGNAGQTNYAASKAGVVGFVRCLAPRALAEYGVTVNAVAPGFIESRMTAAVPLLLREAGRRMNSLGQGGLPVDVAETVAWLATGAVNGQTIRVCGQSLLGA